MALTNPPVTADNVLTAAAFAAALTTITTEGVYVYTDIGSGAPVAPGFTGTAMKAAMAADTDIGKAAVAVPATLAAIVADATSLTTLRGDATIKAAVLADAHVFPTTDNHKVQIKAAAQGAKIRSSAALDSTTNIVARLDAGTVLYISALAYVTDLGVQYKILDGTYVNDFVDREDIEIAPLELRI